MWAYYIQEPSYLFCYIFLSFCIFSEETQTNLCEVTENSRQNQELVSDLTQQSKINEAQIQTLKQEKSKLIGEFKQVKINLESCENEKLEYSFSSLLS